VVAGPSTAFLEVDLAAAAWAACEVVAAAFGRSDSGEDDSVRKLAREVAQSTELRELALRALPRISNKVSSELAGLWHDESKGAQFDSAIENLRRRLEAADGEPRNAERARIGDFLALPTSPGSNEVVLVQVVGRNQVSVFEGTYQLDVCQQDAAVAELLKRRSAVRVRAMVSAIVRSGLKVGNGSPRGDEKSDKIYAAEDGGLGYFLILPNGGTRTTSYDEAKKYERLHVYDADGVRGIAISGFSAERVRPPAEREGELRRRHDATWAARRKTTTPGPFGDVEQLRRFVDWVERFGVDNAVREFDQEARGESRYGRPDEAAERRSYAFAALVALWRGGIPPEQWPEELKGRKPPAPTGDLMSVALNAARTLASQVITADAELRLLWDETPAGAAELRAAVAALRAALD
jgi:hypothetical protein